VPGVAPDIENAAPLIWAALIVMGTFPVLERFTLWDSVPCTAMLANVMPVGVNCQDALDLIEVPLTGTVTGEFESLLAIEMVAWAEVVAVVGAKLTVKLLLALGASCRGAAMEPSEKPVPVRAIAEMSSSAVPALEI